MKTQITPDDIELSEETYLKLDTLSAKYCEPGCECTKDIGSQCYDRFMRTKVMADATRQIEAMKLGWKDDSTLDDWTPAELSLIVAARAQMRKVHADPKIRRLIIMLDNGSTRAARLVRLWRDDKISFDQMVEAARARHGQKA